MPLYLLLGLPRMFQVVPGHLGTSRTIHGCPVHPFPHYESLNPREETTRKQMPWSLQSNLLGQPFQDPKAVVLKRWTCKKERTLVFRTWVKHQHWPVSYMYMYFPHASIWWAHQLVQAGDDSASKSPERLDTERPKGEKFEGVSAFPRRLLASFTSFSPLVLSVSSLSGLFDAESSPAWTS